MVLQKQVDLKPFSLLSSMHTGWKVKMHESPVELDA